MKEIQVGQGKVVIVDNEDYPILSRHRWLLVKAKNTFYVQKSIQGKQIFIHQLIIECDRKKQADHINGNGLDNRKQNIRIVTNQQNSFNQKKKKGLYTSKFKGVCKYKASKKWVAYLVFGGKQIYHAYFNTEIEAAKAYDIKAKEKFGIFAKLNFTGNE